MMATYPPQHIPRPYAKPSAPIIERGALGMEDGAEIAYVIYGEVLSKDQIKPSSCIVFLHGNGEEHQIFGAVIDRVVSAGYVAVGIDSRAQGASSRGSAPLSYKLMADDARIVMKTLGITSYHLVGFSDGAILGLLMLMEDASPLLSATLIGANLTPEALPEDERMYFKEVAAAHRAWAKAYDGKKHSYPNGDAVPSAQESLNTAELMELMLKEPQIRADELEHSKDVTVAVVVGADETLDMREQELIARNLPHAELIVIDGADHNVPKLQPQKLAELVLDLITKS